MIKVYVMYPNTPGAKFDLDYYLNKHMAMVRATMGLALKGMTVDSGVSGAQPGTEPAFRVIATLSFDSMSAFEKAFVPHALEIQGDIPNYTNISPTIQISEVDL